MILTFTRKYQFLDLFKSIIRGKYFLVFTMIFLLALGKASAQAVLVAGTEFNPTTVVAGKTYYGIIDVAQYGMITGSIAVTPPFTPSANANVFNGSPNYAITTNPANLDAVRYENLPTATDYMLVASSPTSTPANLLTYTVPGLVPGSNVSAVVTYCYVISSAPYPTGCTSGDILSLRGVLNPDAYNPLNGLEGTQMHAGNCTTLTITQATSNSNVVPSSGTATFNLNFQQSGSCKVVGVSKIEITGTPMPVITSSEGTDVCTGEQSILTLKQSYDPAATYAWEYSTNGGTSWSTAPGTATNSAYLLTAAAAGTAYQYRVKVTYLGNTYTTSPITINSITCCVAGGSRQTVFYDDFGTLDLTTDPTGGTYKVWDYSNILAPVQVTKTTTTPFRWTLASPPPGTTFSSSGPVGDAQYTVAGGITGYNNFGSYVGAKLQWAGDVGGYTTQPDPAYDHSGAFPGAALFLNVPPHTQNQVIYSRTIPNLCANKQVFFEAWINVFTSSAPGTYHPVNIGVKLIDGGNAANNTIASAIANRQADGGGPWVEIKGTLTLGASSNSLIMQIINNQDDDANGDDLVLDDIRVYACAAPSINLVFNTTTLAQTTTVCTSTMNLYSIFPASLPTFYGGSPYYMYQYTYTPNDYTSWKNLGAPATATSYGMTTPNTNAVFTGVATGTPVYFRVIAAAQSTFTARGNFITAGNYASQGDVCQNYSVSDPISATVSCPLPVEFVSFTGQRNGGVNVLSWSTSMEKNNAYYLIEKSTNGVDFTVIGRVDGKGNSNSLEAYSFQDKNVSDGITYYRLKQVDINGDFGYSKTISIQSKVSEFNIYPNPSNGSFNIQIKSETESYKIDITDLQGKVIFTQSGTEVPGNIQISNLSEGIYILRLYIDNEVITKKLVVYH